METLVAIVLPLVAPVVVVALVALPGPIIVTLVALPPFHSHNMVVRFPLLSSILSLYTYTVLFRYAISLSKRFKNHHCLFPCFCCDGYCSILVDYGTIITNIIAGYSSICVPCAVDYTISRENSIEIIVRVRWWLQTSSIVVFYQERVSKVEGIIKRRIKVNNNSSNRVCFSSNCCLHLSR